MRFPEALQRGDRIAVVAPSGPFDRELLERGIARLRPHFAVETPPSLERPPVGFFSGDDSARLHELQTAMDDRHCKAILIARGGYGLARIAPSLDLRHFSKDPRWLIGFSDVTVLHAALAQRGIASLHAPNGTTLGRAAQSEVDELVRLMVSRTPSAPITRLACVNPGQAEGRLFGGNLTVLFAEAAAGSLKVPFGSILLLEDVTETSYRIDRMLTALLFGGHFARCSGIALGEFASCSPGKFKVPVENVLNERLAVLGIPVVSGVPVGHENQNRPLVLGARVRLDAAAGTLSFLE